MMGGTTMNILSFVCFGSECMRPGADLKVLKNGEKCPVCSSEPEPAYVLQNPRVRTGGGTVGFKDPFGKIPILGEGKIAIKAADENINWKKLKDILLKEKWEDLTEYEPTYYISTPGTTPPPPAVKFVGTYQHPQAETSLKNNPSNCTMGVRVGERDEQIEIRDNRVDTSDPAVRDYLLQNGWTVISERAETDPDEPDLPANPYSSPISDPVADDWEPEDEPEPED